MTSLSIALWLAGASPSAPNLERIRLLPAAPAAGEGGWTLEERMRHYNVPGVSVAVFANDQVLWSEGYGLADREANAGVTPQTLFQAMLIAHRGGDYRAVVMVDSDNGIALGAEILRGLARAYGLTGYLPRPIASARGVWGATSAAGSSGLRAKRDSFPRSARGSGGRDYNAPQLNEDELARRRVRVLDPRWLRALAASKPVEQPRVD
ncbi:MAG TPA: serine hydrolase [Vicinamibacteria bacterium]